MALVLPDSTRQIVDKLEAAPEPTVDYEICGKLTEPLRAEGLSPHERKGAWAEMTPFNLREAEEGSPWGTHYGPMMTMADGRHIPDLAEIDEEILTHWEKRATNSVHPVLRARFADVVWDLQKRITGKPANVQYAHIAIDAYIDGITRGLYKEPIILAVHTARRALDLATSINDQARVAAVKTCLLDLFDKSLQPKHVGAWATAYDTILENKKAGVTGAETEHLRLGLEQMLTESATFGGPNFDPWGAEAAAKRLAAWYVRQGKTEEVHRVIRSYGMAFEQLAAQASPMLAMTWLQPVHEEYKNRGMHDDAARVLAASAEKGKDIGSDLKEVRTSFEITDEQMREFVHQMTQGTPQEALLRTAAHFIPKTKQIKALLQEMLTAAPLMARIGVTRIVGDRFAAHAGSIEQDPEGRLMMQLAQNIDIQNLFLVATLDHLRNAGALTTESIMAVIDESPIFTSERRPLLEEGVKAYVDRDYTKAIHVIIPQIEQALRTLLALLGEPTNKPARNGLFQVKNLNDLLREPAIAAALGEDLRLYLLTFLADERGQNIRNNVCHGFATPDAFNERLAAQTLHALLATSLLRKKETSTAPEMTLLFQYGSNCDERRLNNKERLDGAAQNGALAETVDEYDLAFSVWSNGNQCAAGNLIQGHGTGRHALGILYQVRTDRIRGQHSEGKKTMTSIEGRNYEEHPIKVRTLDGTIHDAITFLVKPEARQVGIATSSAYVKHIVDGLREHNAPQAYIEYVIDRALATNQAVQQLDEQELARIRDLR
jgi:hypothetical protein